MKLSGPLPPPSGGRPTTLTHGQVALAAAGLAVLTAFLASRLCEVAEEDAFIYYRYALNAIRGDGFVFNPPVPVEGFSSPLWMFVLAAIGRWAPHIHVAARIAGLALGAAAIGATALLGRTIGSSRRAILAGGICLAVNFNFLLWAQSGLETPLYALLLILAVAWFLSTEHAPLRAPPASPRRLAGGVLLGLAALGRPEGVLLAALAALRLLRDRDSRRAALAYLPGFTLVFGGYLAWRRWYFDAWLPNTSMKIYPLHFDRSVPQAIESLRFVGVLPVLVVVAGLVATRRDTSPRARDLRFLAAAGFALSYGFHFLAGGDYRPGLRYLVPGLALVIVAAWAALELLLERWHAGRLAGWSATVLLAGVTCAASLALLAARVPAGAWWSLTPPERCLARTLGDPADWGVAQAEWLVTRAPRNALVAYGQMGKVPYRATLERPDLRFIDTVGWVNRRIAGLYRSGDKLRDLGRDWLAAGSLTTALEIGRRRRADAFVRILLECQPDIVLAEPDLQHEGVDLLLASPEFQARYRLIAEIGPPPLVRAFALASGTPARTVDITSCF